MLRTFIFILILVIIKVILSLAPIRFLIYNRFMHVVILKVHNSEANATITPLNRVVTYQASGLQDLQHCTIFKMQSSSKRQLLHIETSGSEPFYTCLPLYLQDIASLYMFLGRHDCTNSLFLRIFQGNTVTESSKTVAKILTFRTG